MVYRYLQAKTVKGPRRAMKEFMARLSDTVAAADLRNIPILCNNTHFILFFKNRCDTPLVMALSIKSRREVFLEPQRLS